MLLFVALFFLNATHAANKKGCTGLVATCQLTVEEHAFNVVSCVLFWSMASVVGATATLTVNLAIRDNQPASNLAQ